MKYIRIADDIHEKLQQQADKEDRTIQVTLDRALRPMLFPAGSLSKKELLDIAIKVKPVTPKPDKFTHSEDTTTIDEPHYTDPESAA